MYKVDFYLLKTDRIKALEGKIFTVEEHIHTAFVETEDEAKFLCKNFEGEKAKATYADCSKPKED